MQLKNLNVDFVLGQQELFDAVDVKGLFESIEKMYVFEEQHMFEQLMISL